MAALNNERGQAAVELAILIPIFALLLYGLVEMSRAWSAYQVVTDAARQGARAASLASAAAHEDSVRARVVAALQGGALNAAAADVQLTGAGAARGMPVEVSVSYPFTFLFLGPWQGTDGRSQITLTSTAVMRKE